MITDISEVLVYFGAARLHDLLLELPLERMPQGKALILRSCAAGLRHHGPARMEYLVLPIHTLSAGG